MVVQGPGPLGVYSVAFARKLSSVVVIGGPSRLEICRMGAITLDRHATTIDERRNFIMDITGGRRRCSS